MKLTSKGLITVALVLFMGFPTLGMAVNNGVMDEIAGQVILAPKKAAKKDQKQEETKKADVKVAEDKKEGPKLDEQWSKDNQALLTLVRDKKNDEALKKAQAMLDYLKGKKISDGAEAATTYNNLGMIYMSIGQFDQALLSLQKTLELRTKIYGDRSLEVANSWNNLSELYKVQAQFIREKKLEEELQKAQAKLDSLKEKNQMESQEAAAAFNTIGTIHLSRGQIERAQTNLLKALEIYAKTAGDKSPEVASVSMNLSELYRIQAQLVMQIHQQQEKKAAEEKKGAKKQ
jgi:tetratricopeptide (TPR) repeat protein